MNCNHFQEHIDCLFNSETDDQTRHELLRHTEKCISCHNLYERSAAALAALTPDKELQAPESLKARILQAAALSGRKNRTFRVLRTATAIAAIVIFALILINPSRHWNAYSAERLFRSAAAQLTEDRPFYLEVEVRTAPEENFAYINADHPFVPHRMWVVPGTPGKWRIDKGDRTALCDGTLIRLWTQNTESGFLLSPDAGSGVLEDFTMLLDPKGLLTLEEYNASSNKQSTYEKVVEKDTITLIINAPAEGDFSNDYMLNTSISESDNHREYTFDRATGRLTGICIIVRVSGKETPVLRLNRIDYDTPVSDSLFSSWPQTISSWIDLRKPVTGKRFSRITPEEAVRRLFTAMHSWDKDALGEIMAYYDLTALEKYRGSRLLTIKDSFRSGQYPGIFVPCLVSLPDNSTVKLNLALRNDNPEQIWLVDGGI